MIPGLRLTEIRPRGVSTLRLLSSVCVKKAFYSGQVPQECIPFTKSLFPWRRTTFLVV